MCNQVCQVEGVTCEGVTDHGVLVDYEIHFHSPGKGGHTWSSKTGELLNPDGTPFIVDLDTLREQRLTERMGKARESWAQETVTITPEQGDDIERAITAFLAKRDQDGNSKSLSFRLWSMKEGEKEFRQVY